MFATTNSSDDRVTQGRYKRLIDESACSEPNITIEWEQGYINNDQFMSLGCTSKCFKDEKYLELIELLPKIIGPGFKEAMDAWLSDNE